MNLLENIFNSIFPSNIDKFLFLRRGRGSTQQKSENEITTDLKNFCIKMICQDKYKENEVIHMEIDENCTHGWALTYDSFCCGGIAGKITIKYKDIFSACDDIYSDEAFKIQYSKNGKNFSSEDLMNNIFNEEFQSNIGEFYIDATELNSNILVHGDELGKFLMKVSNL